MFKKDKYSRHRMTLAKAMFFIAVFLALAAGAACLVMVLWNAILPDVAGVKPLNFWKAAGLLLLAKILFGGFRPGRWRRRHHWRKRWMAMSEEERREAKLRWKERCKRRNSEDEKGV